MSQYFTRDTDKALAKFIDSTDQDEKHRIFESDIRPAFEKLIENLIFVYGFFNVDDVPTLKNECLSNLYEMIPKFDIKKGAKGFSYFNVIAKNWFIHKTREKNKKAKLESDLYYDLDHEAVRSDPNFIIAPHEDAIEEKERWISFYEEMDGWRDRLTKKSELQVLESVSFILRNPDLVTIYNKKAVYLYLREMTGLNTKQVIVALKKLKDLYEEWKETFNSIGESRA